MRYFIILFCCALILSNLKAQNLVPNPSFEEVYSLPCLFVTGGVEQPLLEDYLKNWTAPTAGTSDLYTTLVPDSCYVNPIRLGVQPRSGNNMAGIIPVEITGSYREYLQVQLESPIVKGKSYFARMYVLLNPWVELASNNLGMYFSSVEISQPDQNEVLSNLRPQIVEKEVIHNEDNWYEVSGCFTAEYDAEYLLIGNFFLTTETEIDTTEGGFGQFAYYFIDDVYVGEVAPLVDLGNDTSLCAGETLLLDATSEGAVSYTWLDFFNEPTFLVEEAGTYWVDVTYGQCTFRDSITVSYEPAISLGPDTLLCEGESLLLDAGHPNGAYLWNDGSTASTLEITEPGTYYVSIPSENCLISDTIEVAYTDCPGFIPNVFTPGNDEQNETFYIANIENRQWQLRIFNRWGKEVYFSPNYQNDWNGAGLSSGVYLYHLYSPSLQKAYKGWVEIKRNAIFLQTHKSTSQ
jgi:gliding motility-associated-like protein